MKTGEERDFRAFVDRSLPTLRPVAGALAGGPAAAEELLGEVLATLARRWHRLEAAPIGYAIRLLYRAYAGRRTPGTARVPAGRAFRPLAQPAAPQLGAGGDPRSEPAPGHAALCQLVPRSRALLVLRYYEERGDAEAAAILGTSAVAVSGELTAALEQLRAAWAKAAGGDLPQPFDLEAEVRDRLRELAEAAGTDPVAPSPAELATAALARGQRSNRLRVGIGLGVGAAAAVSVVVLATTLLAGGLESTPGGEERSLTLDLAGQSVVSSYFDRQGAYVLDPETGEYHRWSGSPGVAAPDLRSVAVFRTLSRRSEVRVWSVPEREPLMAADVSGSAHSVSWSPDGAWLAVVLAPFEAHWFSQLALIEVSTGLVEVIDLALPPDRAASAFASGSGVLWLDPGRLAAPTGEAGRLLPPREAFFGDGPLVDAIGVFDRNGALLEELPIDSTPLEETAEPHTGTGWSPHGFLADGRCLFSRNPERGTVYFAAEPLRPDPGPYDPIGVELPDPEEPVSVWSTRVVGWFGTTVIISALVIPEFSHPDYEPAGDFEGESRTYLADFAPAGIGMAQVDDLTGVLPLPEGAEPIGLTFGDAAVLSPAASHLAFTR